MKRTLGAALAIAMTMPVGAGIWEPNPSGRYRLDVRGAVTSAPSDAEERWTRSLVEGLAKTGGNAVTNVRRFGRSSARLEINGEPSDYLLYVDRERPQQFIAVGHDADRYSLAFVVDFAEKTVGLASGSLHLPPSRRFAVVVEPPLFGWIPVVGAPGVPSFDDAVAEWY